jgi:hypothetical protein
MLASLKRAAHLIKRALQTLTIFQICVRLSLQLPDCVFLRCGFIVQFPDHRVSCRQLSAVILDLLLGEGLDLTAAHTHTLKSVGRRPHKFQSSIEGSRLIVRRQI